jgi:hypothetical protein
LNSVPLTPARARDRDRSWADSVSGLQLADWSVNNPILFGKYMRAVEPEYRRLRRWHAKHLASQIASRRAARSQVAPPAEIAG